jgi:hypothetical protein
VKRWSAGSSVNTCNWVIKGAVFSSNNAIIVLVVVLEKRKLSVFKVSFEVELPCYYVYYKLPEIPKTKRSYTKELVGVLKKIRGVPY